jgi:hypothetical protein
VIDQATFVALSGSIAADPLPVDTVKGRRAPVIAYRIAVPRGAAVRQPTVP